MPRKTLRQRKNPTDDSENRVRSVIDNFIGVETADDIMENLMEVLNESGIIPTAGKYYTFVYRAKTLNMQYDEFPLVAVTDVFSWGFRGINFHWEDKRQYDYNQIVGQLYEIYPEEISDVIELPFTKIQSK
jgi:hypothetical protein